MGRLMSVLVFLLSVSVHLAVLTNPSCVIELECSECVPDNMPLVTSHGVTDGAVRVPEGDEVSLFCGGGKFLAYPLRDVITAVCRGGRFFVPHDGATRHLLELGCQENIFEDVLHEVEHCAPPLQGRAYRTVEPGAGGGTRHLATVCFDEDRAVAVSARVTNAPLNRLPLRRHGEARSPLSLLGNFNHMFDMRTRTAAEQLYSDEARLNRRLRELLKHERFSFAEQALTSARLLSPWYFAGQNARAAEFVSTRVAAWASVARGNLRHLHRDVARLLRSANATLDVYTGTHGVLTLRSGGNALPVFLRPGRFPVPQYIWTVVLDQKRRRALALVVLNDPFVAVSEIRSRVFCESACGSAEWLRDLHASRNYEVPLYGLVFCCAVSDFTALVPEMPKQVLEDVPNGTQGMLLNTYD